MPEIGRPQPHKTTHQDGGADEISVEGLAGDLADAQESTWTRVGGKPTTFDPAAHKTSHQDTGTDEVDASGLVGRCDYVDRGDPANHDFTLTNLTVSDAWTDLDLTGIVPAGAKLVLFYLYAVADAVGKAFSIRKNGNSNSRNISGSATQVANVPIEREFMVSVDSNLVIEYYKQTATWGAINLTVRGWWV